MTAMASETVKAAVVDLLAASCVSGRYRVAGHAVTEETAERLKGSNRLVQVYLKRGTFPKGAGAINGPVSHDVVLTIELTTAAASRADLSVFESESATPAQLAEALAESQDAGELADADIDEFFRFVRDIVMSNLNTNLGVPKTTFRVANRWIDSWEKSAPIQRGENAIVALSMDLSFRVAEHRSGATPVAPEAGKLVNGEIKITTDMDSEPVDGAGVLAGG